jgi:4-hydroxymandelate oxidase
VDPVNVREFEALARERLDPVHYDYFAGAAQDEITVRGNESAFARLWTSRCSARTRPCRS